MMGREVRAGHRWVAAVITGCLAGCGPKFHYEAPSPSTAAPGSAQACYDRQAMQVAGASAVSAGTANSSSVTRGVAFYVDRRRVPPVRAVAALGDAALVRDYEDNLEDLRHQRNVSNGLLWAGVIASLAGVAMMSAANSWILTGEEMPRPQSDLNVGLGMAGVFFGLVGVPLMAFAGNSARRGRELVAIHETLFVELDLTKRLGEALVASNLRVGERCRNAGLSGAPQPQPER